MILRTEPAAAAGFTLIEVLVVLAILGVALGLFLARGPLRSDALQVRSAASQMAETLRLARSVAIAGDRRVPVLLDLPTHRVWLDGALRLTLPASARLAAQMADGSTPSRQATFLFGPDGSATGGRIVLAVGTRRFAVTIDWLTGRVGVATQ